MKKIILIAFCLSLFMAGTYAQKGKEIILGVGGAATAVGIVNQNAYGEPEIDYAIKMGYAGSLNLGYNFTKSISVITELQYSLQGQKYDGKQKIDGVSYNAERDIDLGYFNIPLLFKYAFGTGGTKFRFLVGPQVGILLNATQEYLRDGKKLNYGTPGLPKPENLDGKEFIPDANDIKDRYEKTDFSLVVDIGADIHLSDLFYITAGLRGNYGLTEINSAPYRIKNLDGEYVPSNNLWGGVYFGICYKLDVQGYSQRSF